MYGAAGAPPITRQASPSLASASLGGRCPRCGEKTLFAGFLRLSDSCAQCGLDFTRFNVGDGPAAFLILIIGTLVSAGAIALELVAAPHPAVHVVWLPVIALLGAAGIRAGKAALAYQEYVHDAREGRLR